MAEPKCPGGLRVYEGNREEKCPNVRQCVVDGEGAQATAVGILCVRVGGIGLALRVVNLRFAILRATVPIGPLLCIWCRSACRLCTGPAKSWNHHSCPSGAQAPNHHGPYAIPSSRAQHSTISIVAYSST